MSTFDLGLNGLDPDAVGLPTRVEVYARVQGACTRVRLTVRQTQGSLAMFSAEVTPDSNGTCRSDFPLPVPIFPCGFELWVEAECVAGDSGTAGHLVALSCKSAPSTGGGGGGDPNDPNQPGDWPWGLPPILFCPLMGRAFTTALLFGVLAIIAGVSLAAPLVIAAGVAVIAGAVAILAIWKQWCSVSFCSYWGAILWVLKRGVIAAGAIAVVTVDVRMLLLAFALGVLAGMVTQKLRASRCPLPSARTSLQQLPLW
jgi:hypothetical protein